MYLDTFLHFLNYFYWTLSEKKGSKVVAGVVPFQNVQKVTLFTTKGGCST